MSCTQRIEGAKLEPSTILGVASATQGGRLPAPAVLPTGSTSSASILTRWKLLSVALVPGTIYFNCLSKVVCLAACILAAGLFAAALAGMIKKYIDENDGNLSTFAEVRDFINSLAGGMIGSVVSLLPMVLSNTTIAGIFCAAAGIACLDYSGVLKYIWDYLTQG